MVNGDREGRSDLGVEVVWRRTPCDAGECVEVAQGVDGVLLRSSRRPSVMVDLTDAEWRAFLAGVKAGAFEDL